MAKILIVEDDLPLAEGILDALQEQHVVELVQTGKEAADRLKLYSYDLVILDWGLADNVSGVEVCSNYRAAGGSSPIIMLTGRGDVVDKETGLDCGADDYVTKPFNIRELMARVRARLRRPAPILGKELDAGPLRLDLQEMSLTKDGARIELLPKEFSLLEFFFKNPNQFFTAEAILDRVWSSESETSPDIVRVYITRIRKKIDTPGKPSLIETKRNAGYMFVPSPDV